MPAMGPQICEKKLEDMYQETLKFLCEKYNLYITEPPLPHVMPAGREEALKKLREGIEAVYLQDAFEGF